MIQAGDRVTIHFTTRSLEGSVMESTNHREALEFTAGSEEVVRGLSQGVIGLEPGDRTTLSIPPEQGFGNRHQELLQTVPLAALPTELHNGDQLALTCEGETCDLWVHRLMSTEAQVDANHPLAGETLIVDVEIVDVASN